MDEPGYDRTIPKDARMWAMFCHLGGLAGYVGIPFANIIVPAVIWMLKKDQDPFIDHHGKESLNFQISITIYAIIAALLILVVVGLVLLPIVGIVGLILVIVAGVKANDGEYYRYPFTIRLID